LKVHFHMLWLDGVDEPVAARPDKPRLLGPRAQIGEKWPQTARRRAPAMPKCNSRTSDPRPTRRLHDHRLLAELFEKGV